MRKLTILCTLLLMTNSTGVFASSSSCDGTQQNPCVVEDTEDNTPDVKNWRDSYMLADAYQGNVTGLKNIWMSGSGAPSEQGFKTITDAIKKTTQGNVKKIIDVDLREETHGYLNHNAINLTSEFDWINLGKSTAEILTLEQDWLHFLGNQSTIYNVLISKDFKAGKFTGGKDIPVTSVSNEEKIATNVGMQYVRITVSDHRAPHDSDVDKFVTLVKNSSSDTWLHLHCRGGEGRTTTFMAMYDMLRNADKVSFAEILKRQAALPPNYDLTNVNRHDPRLTVYYQERLQFLKDFYQFADASLRGYKGTWSEWKVRTNLKPNPTSPAATDHESHPTQKTQEPSQQ